jgi:PAS domain S-box-containing protein
MDVLQKILETLLSAVDPFITAMNYPKPTPISCRVFIPEKALSERDMTIIDMINSVGHEAVSFCICDPDQKDCPIIFASDGFCNFTGYDSKEIEGRNCRFLQGPDTKREDVDKIRQAVKEETEASVNLLNYRKDGTPFANQFFLSPLRGSDSTLLYFIGVQCSVEKLGPGQAPSNVGWIYSQGLHA